MRKKKFDQIYIATLEWILEELRGLFDFGLKSLITDNLYFLIEESKGFTKLGTKNILVKTGHFDANNILSLIH